MGVVTYSSFKAWNLLTYLSTNTPLIIKYIPAIPTMMIIVGSRMNPSPLGSIYRRRICWNLGLNTFNAEFCWWTGHRLDLGENVIRVRVVDVPEKTEQNLPRIIGLTNNRVWLNLYIWRRRMENDGKEIILCGLGFDVEE